MAPINKIGAIPRNLYNPVEAVKLYETTNRHIAVSANDNPFKGSRMGLGVGALCFVGEGQINGMPPTQYFTNKNGYEEEVQRTFDMFA